MSEFRFLVDVNLPRNFSFFNSGDFHFVSDINSRMSDTQIWNLALKENYIILTRDADFYSRALVSKDSPKIVYFKLGNIKLAELNDYFRTNWMTILRSLENHTILIAGKDSISVLI